MSSVNKAMLIGRCGKDPETRTFQDGKKIVSFTLATSESWKDKSTGERKEVTQWHNVVIQSDGIARVAEQYLKKGSRCYIEGQVKYRSWDGKDGGKNYITEIVVPAFGGALVLLDGKDKASGAPVENDFIDDGERLPF